MGKSSGAGGEPRFARGRPGVRDQAKRASLPGRRLECSIGVVCRSGVARPVLAVTGFTPAAVCAGDGGGETMPPPPVPPT
ncbi:conserved hypothetical protein [Cupriavidus taiwanensis]|nr:conserved hypothetical protein [Cupriavidus taiwanensis]